MERIQDYAIVGDCRSAALISRTGSLDWLAWPRFDSPALFAAILDERAGRFAIRPTGDFTSERAYLEGTNVLETRFRTGSDEVVLTDFMPVADEQTTHLALQPEHELVRRVRCERGELELELELAPRPQFGLGRARWRPHPTLGLRIETGRGLLTVRTQLELPEPSGDALRTRFVLRRGQSLDFSLTFASAGAAVLPPLGAWTDGVQARTVRTWRRWIAQLAYDGPARAAVERSALVLKLLAYAPSGAVVAAATTSLPERIGGELNWDYRFSWLRDASMTVHALFGLGFREEATAFLSWLLHTTRLTAPELRILYDVYGRKPRPERLLRHLSGHRGSRPVRVGNAAADQLQLDVYGEVIDATAQFVRLGGALDRETARMLRSFAGYVCEHARDADEGIWEPRSGRRHHTHSRVLCWAALDRMLELHRSGALAGDPDPAWRPTRDALRAELEARAWNPQLQSYAATLDGDTLDASTLLMAWYGFEPASSPRMRSTGRAIREQLGAGDGWLYRYRDGTSPGEGAFGICGFWAAELLARGAGSALEAQRTFEQLCARANDVGLFAEELDPATGDALGNFPQAFTHVGLINAALSLAQRLRAESGQGARVQEEARP